MEIRSVFVFLSIVSNMKPLEGAFHKDQITLPICPNPQNSISLLSPRDRRGDVHPMSACYMWDNVDYQHPIC